VLIPDVSLTAKGGALFPVTQPIIIFFNTATRRAVGYCLAIVKNDLGINLNIIGRKPSPPAFAIVSSCFAWVDLTDSELHARAENFMTGLKVVFDREKSVLGWEKFDCEITHL